MKFFIHHWYQIGAIIGVVAVILLFMVPNNNIVQLMLIWNLIFLFARQFEEYQLPGGAPLIINKVIYNQTTLADRYPGNDLSITLVNTVAWVIYLLAIIFPNQYWLGLGVILFSLFQILGHCIEMPIKLHAWYNPGMLTSIVLFLPLGWIFIRHLSSAGLLTAATWSEAFGMLIACILLSIILPVQMLKNKQTEYVIDKKQVDRYYQIMTHCRIKSGEQ